MIKLDLHTHSIASHDGGIKPEEYMEILEKGILDYIAITDHDTIEVARNLHASLGDHIIIGEEIMSNQGELIGLFLTEVVKPGMTALATARAITDQGGLVYIPHPFETVRKGLSREVMDLLIKEVDIVEIHNARALFQNRGPEATTWARLADKRVAASSDAHGKRGLGTSYTNIQKAPTTKNLLGQLRTAHLAVERPPYHSLLYPKYHRIRKKLAR